LFIVAMRGRVALVVLAPRASSRGATDQHGITMALRPRGLIPSGRYWMVPVKLHERALGQVL
jgi:hypothetical protein